MTTITREQLETAEPGLYTVDETRLFFGKMYDAVNDRMLELVADPQVLMARVLPDGTQPVCTFEAWLRGDGKSVVTQWHRKAWDPA
jgi:hypothetical protein